MRVNFSAPTSTPLGFANEFQRATKVPLTLPSDDIQLYDEVRSRPY
jgi:hypothetical protein